MKELPPLNAPSQAALDRALENMEIAAALALKVQQACGVPKEYLTEGTRNSDVIARHAVREAWDRLLLTYGKKADSEPDILAITRDVARER
jgi:hypothetical protein